MRRRAGSITGFTLLESLIAMSIGAIFTSSILATWYYSTKVWNEENRRFEARINVEKTIERIKNDVRLSTNSSILFYPQGNTTYTAVSIPLATPNTNGFLTRSGGQIVWDKTVIYHVFGGNELRRTVFSSYNSNAANRQTQLDNVVTTGTTTGATTTALFRTDTAAMEITPQYPTFDGYSATTARSSSTSFGSLTLSAGTHQIRFEVAGKNTASSGYGIGIDSIALTPSGGPQETEALLPATAQSGATAASEDMSSYGNAWGGNYQVNFPASATGHYMTFSTNYDQWLESNFANMTYSNTKTTGTDPYVTLASREDTSLTPSWRASTQTGNAGSANDATAAGYSVRSIMQGAYIVTTGVMMRIKFTAATDSSLTLGPAYFGVRNPGTPNFLGGAVTQLYFDNPAVVEGGTDGTGATANPGTNTGITIPAGSHAWTNWFIYTPSSASDYLISMYVSGGSATVWTPSPAGPTYSYRVTGDQAGSAGDWTGMPGYAVNQSVYASTEMAVWQSSGTATSQIYDTKMTSPAFNQIAWTSSLPTGATIAMSARSSDNADMSGATAWTTGAATSPASIASIAGRRYVQWRATLQAASPYASYPTLDNVKIDWPGQTGSVEVSGYYTKRPSYGIFKVSVDGVQPTLGLKIKVTASGNYRGQTYSYSLTEEQKPLNTGK